MSQREAVWLLATAGHAKDAAMCFNKPSFKEAKKDFNLQRGLKSPNYS
jgi:hypothetical protein